MDRFRRRQFLVAAGAFLVTPSAALSQTSGRVRRIGVLSSALADSGAGQLYRRQIPDALQRLGYREGANLVIEWRWADGDPKRLDALAKELINANVELIVIPGDQLAAEAAKRTTRTIPIVLHAATTPAELGLIKSLARPGGNVTGTSWADVSIVGKLFQILREAIPSAARIAVIRNPSTPDARLYMDAYERAASTLGMSIQYFFVTRPEEVEVALDRIRSARPDALFVAHNPVFASRYPAIVAYANARKLVTFGTVPQTVREGMVFCYSPDISAIYERTASYVDRILRGAKPAELPVELPTKYELIFNAKTARTIGYKIPQSLLARVDQVIE